MNLRQPLIIAGALTAASAALGVWGAIYLPGAARIAMDYGLDGRPHAFMPLAQGLAVMPSVSAFVTLALGLVPRLTPSRKGLEESADAYGLLITSLAALFLVVQAALLAQAVDPRFDVLRWVFLAAAVLLVLVGNMLGKVRHNTVFGVRTPWTLADARVWDKTHRLTGWLMVSAALMLAAIAILVPVHALLIAALVIAAAGPPLAGAIYSARIAPRQV